MELESRLLLSTTPLGVETLVNTATANTQQTSPEATAAVAADANGNFVAVWASLNQDGDSWGIYGQRYNASGVAQGSEFLVNTATVGGQEWASVAMDDAGNFVVTWSTDTLGDAGVRAQRYNASGVAQGGELQVNTNTTDDQQYSSIAMDSAGNFVITWSSLNQDGGGWGVYAQRFNAAGVAQGLEFRVNTATANDQMYSQVAMDADGDFVITWQSNGQDGGGWGIYGQRYNAAGALQGAEFRANSTTANDQRFSSVDMAANGNFVVTWTSTNQDGSGLGIYMQRYNANGSTSGGQTLVNTTTAGDQVYSRVAVSPNGDFLVSWDSFNQDQAGTWGIYAKKYTATGGVEEAAIPCQLHDSRRPTVFRGRLDRREQRRICLERKRRRRRKRRLYTALHVQRPPGGDHDRQRPGLHGKRRCSRCRWSALTLTDADDTNMEGATITISANYVNGQDTLTFTNQNGITGSWNAGSRHDDPQRHATIANYRTALRSITYTNSSDNPSTAARTVIFVVNDGTANSAAATRNINITAVNDAPVLAGIEGAALAYTENDSIPITASITVSDLDNTNHRQRHGANHRQLPERPGPAHVRQHRQHHGTWNAATGTVDAQRPRYAGQLPGGAAQRQLHKHLGQPKHVQSNRHIPS